jgi:hypothetical protein
MTGSACHNDRTMAIMTGVVVLVYNSLRMTMDGGLRNTPSIVHPGAGHEKAWPRTRRCTLMQILICHIQNCITKHKKGRTNGTSVALRIPLDHIYLYICTHAVNPVITRRHAQIPCP